MASKKETKKETKNKNIHEVVIKIDGDAWKEALDKAFNSKKKDAKVDGFRKGKVPKDIYIKKFGIESLFLPAADLVLQDAYAKAMEESKLIPVVQPDVNLKSIDEEKVEFSFSIVTKPGVKVNKYKGLNIKPEKVKVTKEEIEHELSHILEKYTELVNKDGKVENGDIAIIDFEGFKDGVAFEGGKGENYSLTIGSNTFIPGFEDQIIGMSKDEEKDINVTFPEDYHSEDLKGQKVVFKVKVNEIKTTKIPELDKDFFEDLAMEGIDSKESLEKQLEENIKAHKEQHAEDHYIDELLKKGIENMEVDIPEAMINEELDRMIRQYEENLKMQGLTLQQFYQFTNSDETALKDQMKEEAEKRVASRLLLEAIKVEEKIEIADDEAKKEAEELAKKYNMEKDEFLKLFGGIEMVKYDMEMRRAIEILKENN